VRAAQAGDEWAFAQIVAKTTPKVYALCLRLSGNEHDARDIMQDTYLRVFRSLHTFRAESSLTTWIYRIATNCASTHLAKRQHRSAHSLVLDETTADNLPGTDRDSDPQFASESSEERQRLVHELELLPFSLRSVIVLGDVYDLSHEEIAKELKISRSAVKVRLHRGRRRLYEALYGTSSSKTDPYEPVAQKPGSAMSGEPTEREIVTAELRVLRPHLHSDSLITYVMDGGENGKTLDEQLGEQSA
jgi:RNA polymerase sigma-70 factor (ECF subfamily)